MLTSGPHSRLRVNLAAVSVEQSVERAIAERGGQHAPQAHDEEHDFDVDRGEEIEDNNARAEHGTSDALPSPDVLHEQKCGI